MDHDHGDGGGESCPMIMTFHVGNCEAILFKSFTVRTAGEFASAVVVIFLISIAYEGLKFWREKLYNDYATETATVCSSIKASTSELTCNKQSGNKKSIRYVVNAIRGGNNARKYWDYLPLEPVEENRSELLTHKIHIIQTILHFIQVTLSYCLMLIVMTFNVWLVLAVVFGAALGYFFFGWIRQRSIDVAEHCH